MGRKKTGIYKNCLKCNEQFYTNLSNKDRAKYCSISCATYGRLGSSWSGEKLEKRRQTQLEQVKLGIRKYPKGQEHHNWKGGDKACRERHKGHKVSLDRKRRYLLRVPKWLTNDDIVAIRCKYQVVTMLNKYATEKYHVDHVIPIQGKNVCGLHVPSNLQVITAKENYRKSNNYGY